MTPETSDLPILIVDDDEPTQKLIQALLVRFGYSSEVASNGREAIDRLRRNDYSIVILDLMMPTSSGQDVVDFMAAEARRIPVVICTAAGVAKSMVFDSSVVKAVVRKPFDIDQFIEIVNGLMTMRGKG
jgi:two-component system response regulator (stage 0 sporulation protein F)